MMKHEHFGMGSYGFSWDKRSSKVNSHVRPTHPCENKLFPNSTFSQLPSNMFFFGSVRVSNELGASHPRTAKFSLVVAVILSTVIGMVIATVLLLFRNEYPVLFVEDEVVRNVVRELTPMLAFCIVINNVQPVLSGNICMTL